MAKKKDELVEQAEVLGVETSGTKADLQARLDAALETLPHNPDVQEPQIHSDTPESYPLDGHNPDVQQPGSSGGPGEVQID